jgi:hypothetical protein
MTSNLTAKTTARGQSAGRAKQRAASAKAAENKARVAAINEARRAPAKKAGTAKLNRGQQARAASIALGNHRGPGMKVTDAELAAYIKRAHKAHPESPVRHENEYAYWVAKLAISRGRFDRVWDETVGTAKAPAAKRAPAKRAAAKR